LVSNQINSINIFSPVQDQLVRVEELMRTQADQHHPDLNAALKHLLSSGGKRIRPAVVLLTGGMLGGDRELLVTLAAAVELLHTATLVHDDLIDGAFLRRGIATLNSRWSPAATVLTGDFIFSRAARLAADTNSIELMRLFSETLTTIVNGEITQLFSSRRLVNRAEYDQRIYAKTASLFELSASTAAMLSPVDATVIEKARRFGYSIGMAFQLVDDILDFTGQQATLGKPVASDLRQGIFTLPALYYCESHPGDLTLEAILKGDRLPEEAILQLVEAIRDSGAIRRATSEAERYINEAMELLSSFPDGVERQSLEELSRFLMHREM
jgi:geranylgeranyl pyrophosphate synthase